MVLSCYFAVKRGSDGLRPLVAAAYINAVFVGDRSGSMSSMGNAPKEGVADFMRKHKELAKNNPHSVVVVTVVTFDDRAEIAYHGKANNITDIDIRLARSYMIPRNTTRLIDTAIDALYSQGIEIETAMEILHNSKLPRRRWPWKYISPEVCRLRPTIASSFTLFTDGEDNASRRTSYNLSDEIKKHEDKYGTVCLFAAANQDAVKMGNCYGFHRDRSLQIGTDISEAQAAFDSCNAAAVRTATQQSSGYTQAEREASCAMEFSPPHDDSDDDDVDDYSQAQFPYDDTHDNCPYPRAMRC